MGPYGLVVCKERELCMWPHDFIKEGAETGTQKLAKGVACPSIRPREMHTANTGQISNLSNPVRQVKTFQVALYSLCISEKGVIYPVCSVHEGRGLPHITLVARLRAETQPRPSASEPSTTRATQLLKEFFQGKHLRQPQKTIFTSLQ